MPVRLAQYLTKSTTVSRISWGTQVAFRVPQDPFLAECVPPLIQRGLHS